MASMSLEPIIRILDCKNLREERQRINNEMVYDSIYKNDMKSFYKYINVKELDRVLSEQNLCKDRSTAVSSLEYRDGNNGSGDGIGDGSGDGSGDRIGDRDRSLFDTEKLLQYCRSDDRFARLLAGRISKNASRQGTKDEELQLSTCNLTTSKYGVYIENLTTTAFRPTKCGSIISGDQCVSTHVEDTTKFMKTDCLKSFDGRISGKISGWIFAKVVYGTGGHQDNVFEEAHTFCHWVKKFGRADQLYVVLIDTDLVSAFQTLKNAFLGIDHLLIANHIDFQKYIVSKFESSR